MEQQVPTQTQPAAPESVATSTPQAPSQSQGTVSDQSSSAAAPEGSTTPSPFTPNWKFKVMDKEHEIPEYLRQSITDATTEKQVKEIFEKAYGLDVVKPRFKETREELQTTRQQLSSHVHRERQVLQMAEKGDIRGISQLLRIPKEKIYEYALQQLQYDELPPEQKAQMDWQQQREDEFVQTRQTNQQLVSERDSMRLQARSQHIEQLLGTGEVQKVAEKFNSAMSMRGTKNYAGGPKTFRDLVIEQGFLISEATGSDATPEQALQAAMSLTAYDSQALDQAASLAVAPGSFAAQKAAPHPVLPNISGRGASPARKAINSIAGLKERYNEL